MQQRAQAKSRFNKGVAGSLRRRSMQVIWGALGSGVLLAGCAESVQHTQDSRPSLTPRSLATTSSAVIYGQAPRAVPQAARAAVVSAREAMQRRQWEALPGYAEQARDDHELGGYPMYWYLRQLLNDPAQPVPTQQIYAFLQQNKNPYLENRLKSDWILASAKRGDFDTVRRIGTVASRTSEVDCAILQARFLGNGQVSAAQALDVFKPGDACWNMLGQLTAAKIITQEHLEPLLRDAVEYDSKASARRYAALAFSPAGLSSYDALMANPMGWLATQSGSANGELQQLRALAFSRLARQDRDGGAVFLETQGGALLSERNRQWAWTQFGLIAALNLEARADGWYRKAGQGFRLSDYNHAWRTRMALRQPAIDWKWVEQTIGMMGPEQQKEPVWVYWYGRARAGQGDTSGATSAWRSILYDHGFYGQLATEALGSKISVPPQPAEPSTAEINKIMTHEGLQRAIALFRLGWRPEAVGEWNFAIRGMNDRELMAAAEWALREQVYDRAINTSMLTKNDFNFRQRYLAPFEGRVSQQARAVGVDPAWVYGLIRQESRFVTAARSSVGASGLMQVMPGTAQLVARKLGLSYSNANDFDTNTLLGTSYLKMTLDDLNGSEVLATAGYNAGPNRAKRWRDSLSQPLEGAIFAETIPFTETRLYVKHVMSNATWYDAQFSGRSQSLVQRLGQVRP
ncbi:transglycosylase [Advenella kashmirensis WT001]|uniref:Transglycosylase n=1 Tax=Advenella kashmirensis (strain DSM 17095 / LMG 22695 / WT001) TaxID=1036672 RepID=I3U8D2_ADVKW|nr:lytic transglycosylase domain-containing protein [Advenella kashmirensis]AFK61270.1 transglycosylase [Advenella kashmirensis WT001]